MICFDVGCGSILRFLKIVQGLKTFIIMSAFNVSMQKFTSKSEENTLEIAKDFAQTLDGGEVVLLEGSLGAGKSVFVRGVARALGIEKRITSPTFVLMKVYDVLDHATIKRLVHVDAYRVGLDDLEAIGLMEYLTDPVTVVFIEWGEKVKKWLLNNNNKINMVQINYVDEDTREIKIIQYGDEF